MGGQPLKKSRNFKVTNNKVVIEISNNRSHKRFKANKHPGA